MAPLPFAPLLPVPPPPNFFPSLSPQSPHWSQQYSPTAQPPYSHPSVPYPYPYNLPQPLPLPLPPPPFSFGAHNLQHAQSSFLLHRQQMGSQFYSHSAGGGSSPMKIDLGAGAVGAGVPPTISPWPGYRQQREVKLENVDRATNTYIRLLPPEARDSDLHALGSRFGKVFSVRALMATSMVANPFTGQPIETQTCKGVGFILFKSPDEAERAVVSLNAEGFEASFAKESVSLKLRRLADDSSTNLYLTNIPSYFEDHDIVQLLAPATVLSVRILRQNDALPNAERGDGGKSKGIGFARLEDRETADEAIARLNGMQLPGTLLPLRVRYADTREQRKLKEQVGSLRRSRSSGFESALSTPSASGPFDRFRFDSPAGSPSRGNTPIPSLFNSPTKIGNDSSAMQWTPTISPASSMHVSPLKPSISAATSQAQAPGYFDPPPPPPSFIPQGFFCAASDPFQTSHLAHYPAPSPPVAPNFANLAEQEAAAFYQHDQQHPAPSPLGQEAGKTGLDPFSKADDSRSVSTGGGGVTVDSTESTFSFGCCESTGGGSGSMSAGPLKTRFFSGEDEDEDGWELGKLGLARLDRGASLGGGGGEVKEGNGPGSEAWMLRRLEARKSLP